MEIKPAESGYFITATDTEMGKTYFSSALIRELSARGLGVAPMKPVASGARLVDGELQNEDALMLMQASTLDLDYAEVNPYVFEPAIAPHIAAARTDTTIDLEVIEARREVLKAKSDLLVVEGVGGWKVPLGEHLDVETIARVLEYPVILVVGLRLGCINHALLSVDAILEGGCRLTGWVVNQVDPDFNEVEATTQTLIERVPARYLGKLPHQGEENPDQAAIASIVDVLNQQS